MILNRYCIGAPVLDDAENGFRKLRESCAHLVNGRIPYEAPGHISIAYHSPLSSSQLFPPKIETWLSSYVISAHKSEADIFYQQNKMAFTDLNMPLKLIVAEAGDIKHEIHL